MKTKQKSTGLIGIGALVTAVAISSIFQLYANIRQYNVMKEAIEKGTPQFVQAVKLNKGAFTLAEKLSKLATEGNVAADKVLKESGFEVRK